MKKIHLLYFKSLLFLPVLLVVAAVNYTQDPANIFMFGEAKVAQALIDGHMVTDCTLSPSGERLLQKFYIEQKAAAPEVVLLGSSHTMEISSKYFHGQSFFNHTVAGATLEDYIALYGYYKKSGKLPKTVIITVDPWMFNINYQMTYWKTIADSYDWMMARQGHVSHEIKFRPSQLIPEKLGQMFSFYYFQQIFVYLKESGFKLKAGKNAHSAYAFRITTERYNELTTIAPDGSRIPDRALRETTPEEIRANTMAFFAETGERRHAGFNRIDPGVRKNFEFLVSTIQQDGVKVVLLLLPYHPYVYQSFKEKNFALIHQFEDDLNRYADEHGIEVSGSYDPFILGAKEGDFLDGVHFKEAVLDLVLAGNRI